MMMMMMMITPRFRYRQTDRQTGKHGSINYADKQCCSVARHAIQQTGKRFYVFPLCSFTVNTASPVLLKLTNAYDLWGFVTITY